MTSLLIFVRNDSLKHFPAASHEKSRRIILYLIHLQTELPLPVLTQKARCTVSRRAPHDGASLSACHARTLVPFGLSMCVYIALWWKETRRRSAGPWLRCALAVVCLSSQRKIRPLSSVRLPNRSILLDLFLFIVSQSCCISHFSWNFQHSCYLFLSCSLGRRGTCRSSSCVPRAMHPKMSWL